MAQNDRTTGLVGNAAVKVPCKAATTAAITLSGEQTIDGVACVTGDRVLVKDQASGVDNGIYVVDTGGWNRAKDFDGAYDTVSGTVVHITSGSTYGTSWFEVTTADPITIGTTSLTFTLTFLGAASTVSYTPASGTFSGITTTVQTWLDRLLTGSATLGAALVGFLQAGTGAVARTVQEKLRDLQRSPSDFSGTTTAALQAMIDTGRWGDVPPGTYVTTSTLNFTANANIGQRWMGQGSTANDGTGPNSVIIQPTSSVSVAILIDGQGGTALQGWEIGGFTIDMINMTDASTRIGIRQVKAFNGKLFNIQNINEGSNKRAFKFEAGAYTTTIEQCRGTIVELAGNSLVDATTTLTFKNCDFDAYIVQYAASINVEGGAVQGSSDKFTLADVNGFRASGVDIEGTGTAWLIGSNVGNLRDVDNEWSGFSGTYRGGAGTIGGIPVSRSSYGTFTEPNAITYAGRIAITPVVSVNGSSAGVTLTNAGFQYTRNGAAISCVMDITVNSNGAGTGAVTIGTLPFAGATGYTQDFAVNLVNGSYTGDVFGRIASGGTSIALKINNAGTEADASDTNVPDGATIRATFTYQR